MAAAAASMAMASGLVLLTKQLDWETYFDISVGPASSQTGKHSKLPKMIAAHAPHH